MLWQVGGFESKSSHMNIFLRRGFSPLIQQTIFSLVALGPLDHERHFPVLYQLLYLCQLVLASCYILHRLGPWSVLTWTVWGRCAPLTAPFTEWPLWESGAVTFNSVSNMKAAHTCINNSLEPAARKDATPRCLVFGAKRLHICVNCSQYSCAKSADPVRSWHSYQCLTKSSRSLMGSFQITWPPWQPITVVTWS